MLKKISLLPSNSTKAEEALEKATARLLDIEFKNIPLLWDIDNCPVELLPWLAWGYDLIHWDNEWAPATKRAFLKSNYATKSKIGTKKSLIDALEIFKGSAIIREWWEATPNAEPFTFSVLLTVGVAFNITPAFQLQIKNIVEELKPLRCFYNLIIVGVPYATSLYYRSKGAIIKSSPLNLEAFIGVYFNLIHNKAIFYGSFKDFSRAKIRPVFLAQYKINILKQINLKFFSRGGLINFKSKINFLTEYKLKETNFLKVGYIAQNFLLKINKINTGLNNDILKQKLNPVEELKYIVKTGAASMNLGTNKNIVFNTIENINIIFFYMASSGATSINLGTNKNIVFNTIENINIIFFNMASSLIFKIKQFAGKINY